MNTLWNRLLSLAFPATCLSCRGDIHIPSPLPTGGEGRGNHGSGSPLEWPVEGVPGQGEGETPEIDRKGLCNRCWTSIERISFPFCKRCGIPLPDGGARCALCRRKKKFPLRKIRSATVYDGVTKNCILKFKYQKKIYLAGALGELLSEAALRDVDLAGCDHVIPVPMHVRKRKIQGYNHAELLARELCKRTGKICLTDHLMRKTRGRSQTELSRKDRLLNVAEAFRTNWREKPPKKVLLIDDVCTTGATLEECARTLRAAGCRQVYALTVARELPRSA